MIDQATRDLICERISQGEPLRQILRDPGMPSKSSLYRALDPNEPEHYCGDAFVGHFARAREDGYDAIAEDALEIADNAKNDWMKKNDPDNQAYALNGEHVQRSKLRIETRLKLLAKWSNKYSERYGIEHAGTINLKVNEGVL